MKKLFLLTLLFLGIGSLTVEAQYVRVRVGYPAGIAVHAPGPRPFAGAIWIGPEWQWRGDRYHCVPGYWASPRRHHSVWVPGHWKYSRRGHRWVPGHWR